MGDIREVVILSFFDILAHVYIPEEGKDGKICFPRWYILGVIFLYLIEWSLDIKPTSLSLEDLGSS